MIKTATLAIGLLCFTFSLIAEENILLQARASAFFPTGNRLKEIYGDVDPCYGAVGAYRVAPHFDFWVNFNWYSKSAKQGEWLKTHVEILNTGLGLNYIYPIIENVEIYAGLGPSIAKVNLHNKTYCGREKTSKVAWGALFNLGTHYRFNEYFFMDLFVEYLYQNAYFHRRADVGGARTGLGIGIIL